jgi:hypothetical protein
VATDLASDSSLAQALALSFSYHHHSWGTLLIQESMIAQTMALLQLQHRKCCDLLLEILEMILAPMNASPHASGCPESPGSFSNKSEVMDLGE